MTPILVTCLGHGGAFSPLSIGNTAFLVDYGDRRILVDCGTTVPETLAEIGVDPGSITHCIITHLHADHVGGLERLLYHRHYINKAPRLPLIMGDDVATTWLRCAELLHNDLTSHASVCPPSPGGVWVIGENEEISCCRVYHGGDIPNMPGYCFLLELGAGSVFFSGDRIWRHDGDQFVRKDMAHADLAFHELEVSPSPSGAHTHLYDVMDARHVANVRWTHHGRSSLPEYPFLSLAVKGEQWRVTGRKVEELDNLFATE